MITVAGDQSRVADIHRAANAARARVAADRQQQQSGALQGRTAAGAARTADALRQDTRAAELVGFLILAAAWVGRSEHALRQVQRDRAAIAAQPTIAADRDAAADGQTGGVSSHPAAATDALRQQRNRIRACHEHRCRNRRSLGRIDRDLTAIAAGCAGTTGPEETGRAAIAAATADALHDGAMPEIAGRLENAGSCRVAEGQGRATAGARKSAATGVA